MVASAQLIALVREDGSYGAASGPSASGAAENIFGPGGINEALERAVEEYARGAVILAYKGARRGEVVRYRLSPVRLFPSFRDNFAPTTGGIGFRPYDEPKFAIVFVRERSSGEVILDGRVTGTLEAMTEVGERLRCIMDLQASTDETIARLRSVVGGDFFFGMMLNEFEFRRIPADDAPCVPRTLDAELKVRTGFAARPESGPVLPLVLRLAGVTEDPAFDVAVLEVLEDAVASLAGAACGDERARCGVPAWLREAAGLLEERVTLASPRLGRPETWDDVDATLRRVARVIRKD